jgi:hypothetical protein
MGTWQRRGGQRRRSTVAGVLGLGVGTVIPRADAQQNAQAELGGCLHKSPNVAPPLKNELAAPLLVVDPKHIPVTILRGSTGIRLSLKPPAFGRAAASSCMCRQSQEP